jgi:hypothetical protein
MICAPGAERAAVRKPPRSSLATSAMAPGFCDNTMVVCPLVPTSRSMSKYCARPTPPRKRQSSVTTALEGWTGSYGCTSTVV